MTEIIANRYQIEAELGTGGMGTVYRAINIQTKQTVAIKQLHADIIKNDPEVLERFRREGEALRELNHPNIVKMLHMVEQDGLHHLVMEYVSGGDLQQLIREEEHLSLKQCLKLALDLSDALTRAHKLDIIHRDLKPANVLIAKDGTVRLTDFGVAFIGKKERVTETNAIIGTLDYMPPEALQGEGIDSRADIWSFGVMLYEMLTGERPFVGEALPQTIYAIVNEEVPDLEELRPDIPIPMIDLIYRMLEKDPHARISSVRHVGAALEDILQGRDTSSTAIPPERFAVSTEPTIQRTLHNLPLQTTSFVGRETEVAELTRLLSQTDNRLLTILGPGGMGKTRLALEIASRYAGIAVQQDTPISQTWGFPDGVYFVDLAPLSDPSNIINAIAEASQYQFQEDGREAAQQLRDYLQQKHMLLIMDNYEHLMEGAGLVTELLKGTSHLKIIATSRQKLNQTGETIFNLGGMDFPQWETPEDALEYAAVKLFMQSAKRARPDFELSAEDLPSVARICRLVRGMPLGILLAASWIPILDPQEISDEIQQGMDFLESDMGDLPDRHRSIRAVFDYSWDLMNDTERDVFARLSIFKGGFTREAAQAVANANLRTLMTLMNKSLIRRDADSGRYEVHELLRQYAYEQLKISGKEAEAIEAHTAYYSNWLASLEAKLKGHGQVMALVAIDIDFENIRLAWTKAIQHRNCDNINQMIESLHWYFTFRSRYQEGTEFFRLARQQFPANSDTTDLLAGRLSTRFPESAEDTLPIFERALAIAKQHNDEWEATWATRLIGHRLSHGIIDPQKGNAMLQEAVESFQALGDEFMAAISLDDLSWGYVVIGEHDKRRELVQKSVDLRRQIGDEIGAANALRNLGGAILASGDNLGAEKAWQECDQMAIRLGDRANSAWCKTLIVSARIRAPFPSPDDPLLLEAEAMGKEIGMRKQVILVNLLKALFSALHGEYQQALELTRQWYSENKGDALLSSLYGDWAYSIIGIGTNDMQLTRRVISNIVAVTRLKAYMEQFLPSIICFLNYENKLELAAELSGLLSVLPDTARWADNWPPYLQAQSDLEQKLGEKLYQTAFERGKERNIEQTVKQIEDIITGTK